MKKKNLSQVDTNEFISIAIVSILLTLLVEMPFNNIKGSLSGKRKQSQVTAKHLDINENVKEKSI